MTPCQRLSKRRGKRKRMRRLNRKKRRVALVAKIARRLKGEGGYVGGYVTGWDVSNSHMGGRHAIFTVIDDPPFIKESEKICSKMVLSANLLEDKKKNIVITNQTA